MARFRPNMLRTGTDRAALLDCKRRHLDAWMNAHPSHASAGGSGLRYSDLDMVAQAVQPVIDAAAAGVPYVGVNFDDIDLRLPHREDVERFGSIGAAHLDFINGLNRAISEVNPDTTLIVIPIIYANNWLPGTWVYAQDEGENYDYLETIGQGVDDDVIFVWTGESVESQSITDEDIAEWTEITRRKPLIFENMSTCDPLDIGAHRQRTPNAGELLSGYLYIGRGPTSPFTDETAAEWWWNPKNYDPDAALRRAVPAVVGSEAASAMSDLISVFTAAGQTDRPGALWREGRALEVAEPNDPKLAAYFKHRIEVINDTLPQLDRLIPDLPVYQAIRKNAVGVLDVGRAYVGLQEVIALRAAGQSSQAIAVGDRTEALVQEWSRYSTGTVNLRDQNERRDALNYLEQMDLEGRVRALRRGGGDPIPFVNAQDFSRSGKNGVRFGRVCTVLAESGERVSVGFPLEGAADDERYLVITAAGPVDAPVRLWVGGQSVEWPTRRWRDDRWSTFAVPLVVTPGAKRISVQITVDEPTDFAVCRMAVLDSPSKTSLLHATRSIAEMGDILAVADPVRHLCDASTPLVEGRVAVRPAHKLARGVSGDWYDLSKVASIGQTFVTLGADDPYVPPEDPISLFMREARDADYIASTAVMFQRHGEHPLEMSLWRWHEGVAKTKADEGNLIANVTGEPGTGVGESRHWVAFPLSVEIDPGLTYYFELTAPEGWSGWRLRRAYGWYGKRSDSSRSAYLNDEMETGVDIPFRTNVFDVYDVR